MPNTSMHGLGVKMKKITQGKSANQKQHKLEGITIKETIKVRLLSKK
jgi:hypothetical protein